MSLQEFTTQAVKDYLHTIVFVDDEIYGTGLGQPGDVVPMLPELKSPFAGTAPAVAEAAAPAAAPTTYHPKSLLESFARYGMVCALYEPLRNFGTDAESELFKLCARADIVILDWNLYGRDGDNLLPLIENLISESEHNVPHHVRLCAIYTTTPNLQSVADAIYRRLRTANLPIELEMPLTLKAQSTRIVVLGKPGGVGRPDALKALEVSEDRLADRIIEEFSKMHAGILPSFALHGLASVKRNSKRILDKFHSDMDAAFLLHRAALLKSDGEAAFEQLPELLAEEALAVMFDEQVPVAVSIKLAEEGAGRVPLTGLDWPPLNGKTPEQKEAIARRYLASGSPVIEHELTNPAKEDLKRGKQFKAFHDAMGCALTHGEQRLAALFNIRTNYVGKNFPQLGFGTIVRQILPGEGANVEYSICLMPLCDGIRLTGFANFPFWRLKRDAKGGRGIVVESAPNQYINLVSKGKPRDMLWLESFQPDGSGAVTAERDNTAFLFTGTARKLEWVAQLKPAHAQRVAHDIGQTFSRVGVIEAEWLRLMAGS